MKNILLILLFFLFSIPIFPQTFDIVYLADTTYANNSAWLSKIKNVWSATGINLRVRWSDFENDSQNYHWNSLDSCIKKIADDSLYIYLRVCLWSIRSSWYTTKFNSDDFHMRANGTGYYSNVPPHLKSPDFESPHARQQMKKFFQDLISHLNTLDSAKKARIKLITPTLSSDDESEYPFAGWDPVDSSKYVEHVGFASWDKKNFMTYLTHKYGQSSKLNEKWGSNFFSIDTGSIKIDTLNWYSPLDSVINSMTSIEMKSKIDWIDYKTKAIKGFFHELRLICVPNFKFGIQVGSIYNNLIEFEGFYDPTSFFQEADYLITGDVPEYQPNFNFGADYLRSIAKYAGPNVKFATETNWPGYIGISPDTLGKYWTQQVSAYIARGSSALFISHWGTDEGPGAAWASQGVLRGRYEQSYHAWKDYLSSIKGNTVTTPSFSIAVLLSPEQALNRRDDFIYNRGENAGWIDTIRSYEFPFIKYTKPRDTYSHQTGYNGFQDIVTNYMITDNPKYLLNYSHIFLTASSYYMPDSAYVILMSASLVDKIRNATEKNDATGPAFTPAARDERNNLRFPLH